MTIGGHIPIRKIIIIDGGAIEIMGTIDIIDIIDMADMADITIGQIDQTVSIEIIDQEAGLDQRLHL